MNIRNWPAALLCVALVTGCEDTVTEPTKQGFPEKRYPYTVSFEPAVYKQRRDDLVQRLPSGSMIIAATNRLFTRNGDVDYEFRPASTFFYLTGFDEPNAVAVIRRNSTNASELLLFVEERTGVAAQWLGPVYGIEGAIARFRADSAYAIGALSAWLAGYFAKGTVQTVVANLATNDDVRGIYVNLPVTPGTALSLDSVVNFVRPVKSPSELAMIRNAVEISVQAFEAGIKATKPLMYEYEVEAVFDYILKVNGCPWTAFPTIVASGPNSSILHYTLNSRQMQTGDLVMIDFGAEYGYYAADLTRTIPVSGTFSPTQAIIYDIVKESHDLVLSAAKPGVTFSQLSSLNIDKLIDGLIRQGVITGVKSVIISTGQYQQYIPAGLGHQIGLDVHDPWPVDGTNWALRENMTIAIEPHLYLNTADLTVSPAYRGINIRIEDDILITATGCEIVSAGLPSTRSGIQTMMKKSQ